jgi:N-acetylglucosaminyl-diphospho-decaprenol L-rhamnosyltransferase
VSGATDPVAVDVVVVNYNGGDHLLRCVASVFAHAGDARVTVAIVDNDSADGSAQRAAGDYPAVRLIANRDNVGFGSAANQGIASGTAPWVFLLNPDAEIAEGALSDLLRFADAKPRGAVVGALVRDPDGSLYPSARKIPTLSEAAGHALVGPFRRDNRWSRSYTMEGWDRRSERSVDWVSGSSMLLRRSALERVGAFDPGFFMYAEDADLCTRMRAAGYEVWFTPLVTVVHDHGLSTRGSRRMIWEHSRSIGRYFAKHYATGWRRVFLPPANAVLWLRAAIVSRRMWRP